MVGLVGRDPELARVRDLLASVRAGRSEALVIEGEPGIGKTTLLEAARSLATDFTCLDATGIQTESSLSYAALLQLLHPVRDLMAEIPETQATALAAALGWGAPQATADRFLVSAATLSLLAASAERAPVLVVVDDLQWVDTESAAAVIFAARRFRVDRVAFAIGVRRGEAPARFVEGLPVTELRGVPAGDVARLLPPGTSTAVLQRLVDSTNGNPLALLETSRRLSPAQRLGAAPLPDPLPAGSLLTSLYADLISGVAEATSDALLLLATDTTHTIATVAKALAGQRIDPRVPMDEALASGILVSDPSGIRFRHPLLRHTVLACATAAQRREAHLRLAEALPAHHPARVWHRAEAAIGPDDALADELASVSDADRMRLGYAAASAALERSAALTSDERLAAERLSGATEDAFMAGDVARTRSLAARVNAGSAPPAAVGQVAFTMGMLEQYAGSVPRSVRHLGEAARLLTGAPQVRALAELALARFRLNDLAGIADCAVRIDAVADASDAEQRLLASFTAGMALVLGDRAEEGLARLADAKAVGLSDALRDDPRALMLTGVSAALSGRIGDEVAEFVVRIEEVRRRGAIGVLVPSLALLAAGRAWVGDHRGAFADAAEAADLAEQIGYAADAAVAVEMLAWQSAARGLHDDARRELARARVLIERAGITSVAAHYAWTAAYCALCRGDLDEVVTVLETRIAIDGGLGSGGEPLGVAPLLVEAYVALGRVGDARELGRRYLDTAVASPTPLTMGFVGRCLGLTSDDDSEAEIAYERGIAAHVEAGDVFECARTRMLRGARLRRSGQRVAARAQLGLALDAFTEMDLALWARAAADELAATGATRRHTSGAGEPLSSQETRVALLVAKGLSNREVAAAMFLSPKTIERHLGSVFRKRGFRSRTEVAAAYARHDEP